MDIEEIIDEFNNGNSKLITKFFGDYETFFKFLSNNDLLYEIDPTSGAEYELWANEFLLSLYKDGKIELFNKWVSQILDDVEFYNDKPFLEIKDLMYLSGWFCDDRSNSREWAENILSGEYDYDYYDSTSWMKTDDLYDYVIRELNITNLNKLKSRILKELDGSQIEPETELLEDLVDEESSSYVNINSSNIDMILKDHTTMTYLLSNYLVDIKSDLFSTYDSAYGSAVYDRIYSNIWDKLELYFDDKPQYVEDITKYQHPARKITYYRLPIRNFYENILEYLEASKDYGNTGTLNYYGEYVSLIADFHECLRLRISDYPDNIDKHINDIFDNYF